MKQKLFSIKCHKIFLLTLDERGEERCFIAALQSYAFKNEAPSFPTLSLSLSHAIARFLRERALVAWVSMRIMFNLIEDNISKLRFHLIT